MLHGHSKTPAGPPNGFHPTLSSFPIWFFDHTGMPVLPVFWADGCLESEQEAVSVDLGAIRGWDVMRRAS